MARTANAKQASGKARAKGKAPAARRSSKARDDSDSDSDFVDAESVSEESSDASSFVAEDDDSEEEVAASPAARGKKRKSPVRTPRAAASRAARSSQSPAPTASSSAQAPMDISPRVTPVPSAQNPVVYVAEVAKTGQAMCRKCDERIAKGELRVGLVMDGDYGLFTRWQHLNCTIFQQVTDASQIGKYDELPEEMQQLLQARVADTAQEEDDDLKPIDADDLVRTEWTEQQEPPSELLMPLLPYQREGLAWMCNQERIDIHGGILADEMGMGKTIQAISLILANKASDVSEDDWRKAELAHERSPDPKRRGGTLVICPLVALLQWESEILRFTKENSLKVVIQHGPNRATDLDDLRDADVVLTTYAIVEAEHRKMTAQTKVACPLCGKKFYPAKLRLHRRYFCGDDAVRTEAQSKTQRKRQQSTGRVAQISDSEESEFETGASSSSDDEVSRQKKRIKAIASRSNGKGKRTSSGSASSKKAAAGKQKANGRVSKKAAAAEEGDEAESSEDEVTKQKKRIKALAAVRSATGQDPASAGKRSSRSAKKAKVESGKAAAVSDGLVTSDEEDQADDESEDEVTKQKKRIKALANGNGKGSSKANGKGKGKAAAKKNDQDEFYDPVIEEIIHKAEKAAKKVAQPSLLHEMSWFRIILDEAHCIKDRSTSTAKAVFELASVNKWCLTGTPLQNRVGELYSLVRFLRLDPHAYYFCRTKGCDCKSLHYRFGPNHQECEECGHTPMNHFAHFNKHILNPIKRCGYITEGKQAMLQLKREILDKILLRRTKTTRSDDILLPPRLVRLRADRLDEREEDFYQALYTQSQAQFDTYIQAGTVLHNYAHIFDILIRLRQAVDHPYLVMHSSTRAGEIDQGLVDDFERQRNGDANDGEGSCELCREMAEDPVVAACSHVFCRLCVEEFIQSAGEGLAADCPQCSRPLTIDLSNQTRASQSGISSTPGVSVWDSSKRRRQSIIHRVDLANFQSSTKLEALMEELDHMQEVDPSAKAIVFSQFVNMLDLIEYRIQVGGYRCVKLVGSMSVDHRDKAITSFKEDPDVKVLLISLKAGGVALNLTVANHIYIMDPWWNPAAEMQAIDRTHRIGQYKPIYATRFIIENTIEERILKLQEKKKLVFDGTVGGDATSLARLTINDLRFLFTNH